MRLLQDEYNVKPALVTSLIAVLLFTTKSSREGAKHVVKYGLVILFNPDRSCHLSIADLSCNL